MANFRKDIEYGLYCHLPGSIVSYDRTTGTASVQIGLVRVIPDYTAPGGKRTAPYPPLSKVPVYTLQAGGASAGGDPKAGDTCLIAILDRNVDAWIANGGQPAPLSDRAHDLSDAFVFVGFNPLAAPLVSARLAGEFGIADALAKLVVKDGKVNVSNGPLPANSLGGILDVMLTAMGSATTVGQVAAAANTAKAALALLLY
jgi:hypothetical protein